MCIRDSENGGFYDSYYDFGGTDSLPNVHLAITALAGLAMIQSLARPELKESADQINNAIERCFKFVNDEKRFNRVDRDEILWAEAYRLRFLSAYCRSRKIDNSTALQAATGSLEKLQSKRGGWYHEYANPFVTATALAALHDAKTVGAAVNTNKVDAGLRSLLADRFANGAFSYSSPNPEPNRAGDELIQASAGRMPLCELALSRWGHSDQQKLQFAIEQSFKHHEKMAKALKYDDHTSTLAYGGFFFWYDMRSRTEAISALQDEAAKTKFSKQQFDLVMALPEIDGCFVDSHELGRCYGTAMALLCLSGSSNTGGQ